MGVFDNIRKILFDEEIEDVPAGNDELPVRTPKAEIKRESGFIDHSAPEEDTIKEVVYSPSSEEIREERLTRTSKYAVDEYEKKDDIPRQISRYEESKPYGTDTRRYPEEVEPTPVREEPRQETRRFDFGSEFDRPTRPEPRRYEEVPPKKEEFVQTDRYGLRRDYKAELNKVPNKPIEHETKNYSSIVRQSREETPGKKPFEVTPVISPVYGILDKNYTPDSVIERHKDQEVIDRQKKRIPVEPTVKKTEVVLQKVEVKPIPKKEDEYLESIRNIIDEDLPRKAREVIEETKVEDAFEDTNEFKTVEEPTITYEETKVTYTDMPTFDEPSEPIYEEPSYEEPVYENTYETREFEEPVVEDSYDDYEAPSVSIDTLIDNPMEEDEAPVAQLDDTIETDLFNLIDSMYKSEGE